MWCVGIMILACSKVVMDDFEQKWSPIVAEDGQIAKSCVKAHKNIGDLYVMVG